MNIKYKIGKINFQTIKIRLNNIKLSTDEAKFFWNIIKKLNESNIELQWPHLVV